MLLCGCDDTQIWLEEARALQVHNSTDACQVQSHGTASQGDKGTSLKSLSASLAYLQIDVHVLLRHFRPLIITVVDVLCRHATGTFSFFLASGGIATQQNESSDSPLEFTAY